jgi:hypothetical protein
MTQDNERRISCLRKKIKLEKYVSYQKIKNQLVTSEYIKLNIIVIVL